LGGKFANFGLTFSNHTNKLTQKKIVIGLATFKRPQMLSKTLESLRQQRTIPETSVELVLVDNDEEKSALPTFEQYHKQFAFALHYFNEPVKGIASARNRIVEESLRLGAHYLAFMDDDEIASTDWIFQLYEGLVKYDADVVTGSSERIIPADAPEWIKKGRFFALRNRPSGEVRKSGSTRNVLFDLQKLCVDWKLRFHPGLNLVGSSDAFFFEEAYLKGARIVSVAEASIVEELPASRLTAKWILSRSFRGGNSKVARRYLRHGAVAALAMLPQATGGLLWGTFIALITLPAQKQTRIRNRRGLYYNMGVLSAIFGYRYQEYKKAHGH